MNSDLVKKTGFITAKQQQKLKPQNIIRPAVCISVASHHETESACTLQVQQTATNNLAKFVSKTLIFFVILSY